MDRLTSVGRMAAVERLAALIIHVYDRRCLAGGAEGLLDWPFTQQQIGDILGLTSVHVNRMLHQLEQRGFISRSGQHIQLVDAGQLRGLAMLPERKWVKKPAWLSALGHET